MKNNIENLFNLFIHTWITHWKTGGSKTVDIHATLDVLYNELKDFLDELVELAESKGEKVDELLPEDIKLKSSEYNLNKLVANLIETRKIWLSLNEDPIYSDFKGRLITRLSHYIFVLQVDEQTLNYFSNKSNDLVISLKKYFKNQNEFVTVFNAYLKGKKLNDTKVTELFKNNESELNKLSDTILNTNTQLFSLREYYSSQSDELKKEFNTMARFFDIFQ